jgi:genome maintenance exonuclease 1
MLISPYDYKSLSRKTDVKTGTRFYATPDREKLPSVTSILSRTKPKEDLEGLRKWRERVGENKAREITKEAGNVGTLMHQRLEWFVQDIEKPVGGNMIHQQANNMSKVIIENGLKHMDEFWGTEVSLWYPGLYAGSTDLIGTWKGKPAIIDFKQSNRLKKDEYIDSYKLQLCAYAMAHNEVYGTDIKTGVVLVCTRALEYQEFVIEGDEFEIWADRWISSVEAYYQL